jgi:ATP-dependent Lon protease
MFPLILARCFSFARQTRWSPSPRHSWIAARSCIYLVRAFSILPQRSPNSLICEGYTYDEKLHIASRFLLPKQLEANGLDSSHIALSEPALLQIVTGYTREAGVRSLERAIGSVVRYKAVEWAEHNDQDGDKLPAYQKEVGEEDLEGILGIPRYEGEKDRSPKRGLVYGLVVSGLGEGSVLPIETCAMPGKGDIHLTGSLGDVSSTSKSLSRARSTAQPPVPIIQVIKESSSLALSWVKTHAYDLRITSSRSEDPLKVPNLIDIHLHLPAGAQKKVYWFRAF